MNIQNIGNNYRNNSAATFRASYQNYRLLQNIHGIRCACCGREVINLDNISKTYSRVAKPLSEMMQRGFLDRWHEIPHLWGILVHLKEKYPNDSLDRIVQKNDKNYTNVRKTLAMDVRSNYYNENKGIVEALAKKVYKALIYDSREELKSSRSIVRNFKKYKKYLDGSPLKVFERLQMYSRKYPNMTLSEIIANEDVYNYHKARNEAIINNYSNILDLHFGNILKLVKAEDPLSLMHFRRIELRSRSILVDEKDPVARIPRIKDLYINNLKHMKCENIQDSVLAEIEQIPAKYDTESAFFVTAHDRNWSDGNIIKNIFAPFCGTVDHLSALSKGGVDNIYNTLVMCQGCNYSKSNKDINQHLKYHPQMPKYTEEQIQYISDGIINRQYTNDGLFRWPIFVSANLRYYTDGRINPDIREYKSKVFQLTKVKQDENIAQIKKLESRNEELKRLKEEIEAKINEISTEITENIDEIDKLNTWVIKNEKDLDFFARDNLEGYYHGSQKQSAELEQHQEFTDDFCGDCC